MYLLVGGVIALVWNLNRIGLVFDSSWWWVAALFAGAVVWWACADASGYTKRKEMEKMAQKKLDRIDRQHNALGIKTKRR